MTTVRDRLPKPIPTSFDRESFFEVSAFRFTNAQGEGRCGRYRVLPLAGNEYWDEATAAAKMANFLFDEIQERLAKCPVQLRIVVQPAEAADTVDDATARWPEDRPQITGEIGLTAIRRPTHASNSRSYSIPSRERRASGPRPNPCLSRAQISI